MEFFDGITFDIAKQKYYNANKVWIPEKNVEKLKTLESQKEARRRFLSRIK